MPEQTIPFTFETVCQVATANVAMFQFSGMAFLKERGIPVSDWSTFIFERVGPGWDALRGQGARALAVATALNLISVGGTLVDLGGNEQRAEIVVDWNVQPLIDVFVPLTLDDVRQMLEVFGMLARRLGLHHSWSWEANRISMTFTQ